MCLHGRVWQDHHLSESRQRAKSRHQARLWCPRVFASVRDVANKVVRIPSQSLRLSAAAEKKTPLLLPLVSTTSLRSNPGPNPESEDPIHDGLCRLKPTHSTFPSTFMCVHACTDETTHIWVKKVCNDDGCTFLCEVHVCQCMRFWCDPSCARDACMHDLSGWRRICLPRMCYSICPTHCPNVRRYEPTNVTDTMAKDTQQYDHDTFSLMHQIVMPAL